VAAAVIAFFGAATVHAGLTQAGLDPDRAVLPGMLGANAYLDSPADSQSFDDIGWQGYISAAAGDGSMPDRSALQRNFLAWDSQIYQSAPMTRALGDPRDFNCLALTVYHEARGESDAGMRAVANVVMNRVEDPDFPDTVCDVTQEGGEQQRYRCQFSWWCDGRSDQPRDQKSWEDSYRIALEVYWNHQGRDVTGGALWYHADYVAPSWRRVFAPGPTIGNHIFYRRAQPIDGPLAQAETSSHRGGPWTL